MQHDVGPVVDLGRMKLAACSKGVVHDQRCALVVGDLGDGLEVGHVVARVANALYIDSLVGVVVNGGSNVLGVVSVNELGP